MASGSRQLASRPPDFWRPHHQHHPKVTPKNGRSTPDPFSEPALQDIAIKIVPATDLNGNESGRGEIPHIPKNAILPATLSGLDTENKVRLAIKVTLDAPAANDTTYEFEYQSVDESKATVTCGVPLIPVTVKAGETVGYSNQDVTTDDNTLVVTGGVLSVDSNDTVDILVQLHTESPDTGVPTGTVTQASLLRYEFVGKIVNDGAPQPNFDPEIQTDVGLTPPLADAFEVWPESYADRQPWPDLDWSKTPTVEGFERVARNTRVSAGGIDIAQQFSFNTFTRSGGSTAVGHSNTSWGWTILFNKTSDDRDFLLKAIYQLQSSHPNPTHHNGLLSEGDARNDIEVTGGTFWHRDADTGSSRLSSSGTGNVGVSEDVTNWSVWTDGIETYVKQQINSSFSPTAAEATFVTNPAEAFNGTMTCRVRVERSAVGDLYAYASADGAELTNQFLEVGGLLPLDKTAGMVLSSTKILTQSVSGEKPESGALVTNNLCYVMPSGTKVIDANGMLSPIVGNALVVSSDGLGLNTPDSMEATARGGLTSEKVSKHRVAMNTLIARSGARIAFRIGDPSEEHTPIYIYVTSGCGARKNEAGGVAYGGLELGEVSVVDERMPQFNGQFAIYAFGEQAE